MPALLTQPNPPRPLLPSSSPAVGGEVQRVQRTAPCRVGSCVQRHVPQAAGRIKVLALQDKNGAAAPQRKVSGSTHAVQEPGHLQWRQQWQLGWARQP